VAATLDDDRQLGYRRSEEFHRDHGSSSGVDDVDDLGAVDALEVDRGDAEAGVPELALDDDQRYAFARHVYGMRVCRSGDDAEQRADGEFAAGVKPGLELFPSPLVHAEFAASAALASPHQKRSPATVKIGLAERQRFVDAKAGAPQHDDQSS
jgi:hypothetical protein